MIKNNTPRRIKTDHIYRMTDDTGILHHSNCGVPDRTRGYTTIDNARALIMAVKLYEQTRSVRAEGLINKYVAFLANAQNADGTFQNLMDQSQELPVDSGLEECFGRCLWALCFTFSDQNISQDLKAVIWEMIDKALKHCMKLKSSRAVAYVIIGLSYLDQEKTNGFISKLAALLVDHYVHYREGDWLWFEERLTCCNASLPWALLTAFRVTKEARYLKVGLESLSFLQSKTFTENYFKPIGIEGLHCHGVKAAQFDEQALEASETASMYIEAYLLTNNLEFLSRAKTCFYWYLGKNSKRCSLMDPETGGCHDGIDNDRLNPNQSAESIISFWLAYLGIRKYIKTDK